MGNGRSSLLRSWVDNLFVVVYIGIWKVLRVEWESQFYFIRTSCALVPMVAPLLRVELFITYIRVGLSF